jgi:hypothetical protein
MQGNINIFMKYFLNEMINIIYFFDTIKVSKSVQPNKCVQFLFI